MGRQFTLPDELHKELHLGLLTRLNYSDHYIQSYFSRNGGGISSEVWYNISNLHKWKGSINLLST